MSIAQPFGIYSEGLKDFLIMTAWILPLSSVWFFIILLTDYLAGLILNNKNITNYKTDIYIWLIKILLVVHVIFVIRGIGCQWQCLNLVEYAQLWFACVLFYILTYIPFTLYAKYLYVKETFSGKNEKQTALNTFEVADGRKKLAIEIANISHFNSDDNYIDVFYLNDQQETQCLTFRSTMKELEMRLRSYPQFIRVHRSYMVNMNYFKTFQGNPAGGDLTIAVHNRKTKIPVSRKYKVRLTQLIN